MKIVVSNPIKHHSHQLAIGLNSKGYFYRFFTSVWLSKNSGAMKVLQMIPLTLTRNWVNEFQKRSNDQIDGKKVLTFPVIEVLRKLLGLTSEKWVFISERAHDQFFHYRLKRMSFDIFIGTEKSSLKCFQVVRRFNKLAILDLAQIHFGKIQDFRNNYSTLNERLVSGKTLEQINRVKEQEINLADYIFTLSELTKQSLIDANVNEKKIRLINLGFDPNRFRLKSYKKNADTFTLLYVGAVTRRKGLELICKSLRELNIPNIKFIIIGSLVERDLIEKYIDLITYHPFLPHHELVKFYQQSDLFVFPSYLDSWGMVVLEAMACGTPVIVSENTGSKDVVRKGGGFVIPPDDINSLTEKIKYFYDNPDELERIGKEANSLVQSYTWENYHSKLLDTLDEIYRNNNHF